eukprot:731577-Amphidinium_carterae.1
MRFELLVSTVYCNRRNIKDRFFSVSDFGPSRNNMGTLPPQPASRSLPEQSGMLNQQRTLQEG